MNTLLWCTSAFYKCVVYIVDIFFVTFNGILWCSPSRLAEAELQLDTAQQSVSQLTDRLEEERGRREAAEEALGLADTRIKR